MNKTFNWHKAEYPCFGIDDNKRIVCFSSYCIGHNIEDGEDASSTWIMGLFKPYTKPEKPKTESWAKFRCYINGEWIEPNYLYRNLEQCKEEWPTSSYHHEVEGTRVNLPVVED